MSTVTCSDGPNGLMSKYPTQGALPGFPNIGGVPGVGWNSPSVRLSSLPSVLFCPGLPNHSYLLTSHHFPIPPHLPSPSENDEKKTPLT